MANELGNFLREQRGTISLREFAKRIGISHTYLDCIEKGFDFRTEKPVSISVETLRLIADGLGLNVLFLANLACKTAPNEERKFVPMKNLQGLRKAGGFTLEQVGMIIKASAQDMRLYESGARRPTEQQLQMLADFFEVPVEFVASDDGVLWDAPDLYEDYRSAPPELQRDIVKANGVDYKIARDYFKRLHGAGRIYQSGYDASKKSATKDAMSVELDELFQQLPEDEKKEVLNYARYKVDKAAQASVSSSRPAAAV